MALLSLTVNNASPALDKQHQETQLIQRALVRAAGDPGERREEDERQHHGRCRQGAGFVDVYAAGVELTEGTMAKLTSKKRRSLAKSSFAEPGKRKYPIPDKSHARNALSRVAANGTAAEKKQVRAAVHRKFPSIGKGKR